MSRSKNLNSSPPAKSRVIQVCLFLGRLFLLGVVTLVLLIGVAWAFGALWFDFPFSALRRPLAAAFGLGALAALAFELGAIDPSLPFAELRRLSYIDYRARDADDDPTFSSLIRKGLPGIP